ncbi:hypothetical protein [Sphingobacterium paucimobilis]|uniref:Uncharacterized protein n=1 Tax=Sphingobacterium paucimobilis HER1398 TaxID=1346330 RepID=U2I0I3_9SPHI|nr:hypothetical protein [Sphingobacterium paucimobilis]ERJ61312.1 hypothetical protein M472_21390 [Sphingobacterium paucimobilis HER1398]
MAWFSFTGTDPSNPAHYTFATSPPSCSTPKQAMCSLQANDNGGSPDITDALKNELINSLQNQVDGPNVKLKKR